MSQQPRISGGKKSKKEFSASSELEVKNTSPMSEQDSGILDVEDEDEEEEVTVRHQTGDTGQCGVNLVPQGLCSSLLRPCWES